MTETAFTSANEIRLKKLANEGNAKAAKTLHILENYDKFLTTTLIGNNLVNIAGTSIATLLFALFLGAETGAVASTVVMTLLVLMFGEIIPKSYAKRYPEKVCMKTCGTVYAIEVALTPLSWIFSHLTRRLSDGAPEETLTEDELEVMIDEVQSEGVIEQEEGELVKSALRFDDIQASEIYVPRMDVVGVDVEMSNKDLGMLISSSQFSRYPVYEKSIDNIIGVIYAKEFYSDTLMGVKFTIRDIMKPVKYVPETMSIAKIMKDFQRSKIHMAVVLDSYGGTMGIITMEDILEELVGEIWDESDEVQHEIVKIDDDTYLAKGVANIFDLTDMMCISFDPGDYEDYSVNGYIFYRLGRGPARGDVVDMEEATITVRTVKGRRVTEAVFRKKPKDAAAPTGTQRGPSWPPRAWRDAPVSCR
jgi:CBS domain containing-hemolysin-like protein